MAVKVRYAPAVRGSVGTLLAVALVLVLVLVFLYVSATAAMVKRPQSVVSMNLCTDELVLMLADPVQIKSVTWLVKDPMSSWLAERAEGIQPNHGLAEEIVNLQPDLVVAGTFTTPTTIALLKKLGVSVLQFAIPGTLDEVKAQIVVMARALGQAARGAALIADMEERLATLPPIPLGSSAPTAALYQPNGLTATEGTLAHEALMLAGLQNLAVLRSLPNYTRLPMEVLLLDQPDVLVMNSYAQAAPSLAQELLQHPALRKTYSGSQIVVVPAQAWSCGSPNIVRAIELLRGAAIEAVAGVPDEAGS